MRVATNSYRGEAPRVTPRALPENGAQIARNARLLTGDLEAWRQFALEKVLENSPAPVESIYKLKDKWLSWLSDVDVARGAVAGDTTYRVFLTGPDEYGEPRWTNYSMATTGSEPFPVTTRPLGVPSPDGAPVVTPGVDPNPSSFSIDVLDEGGELTTSWTTSPPINQATFNSNVAEDNVLGWPAPSYQLSWRDYGDQANVGTFMKRNFGIGKATAVVMELDWQTNEVAGRSMLATGVQRDESGVGISVRIEQAAAGSWVLTIGTAPNWEQGQNQGTLASAVVAGLAANTHYRKRIEIITNADGTRTVTAKILSAVDVELGTLTTTVDTTIGDWCGFAGGYDQLGGTSTANVDNIHVTATGSTGYNPVETATNYVYTFVNDIGEESAPSFASVTVLRPDGVSITVTTPTGTPTGVSSGYGITTKRIYRAATGATGTFYRFVAEIPLAQADYVDALPDTELGELLQSELWALPPADMRGMLALPNGVMAGFSKNQLCLSAQNHPHAWPVEYRLNVDTDIVAIGAIDTTVVIGTQNFIYLALGTDPAAYSMTKLEVPQACVAKRSLAYLIGTGVVFASPDGLIAVAGNGNVRNLTSGVFTREQWQALGPETIIAVAHDDVYHFWYGAETPPPEENDVLNVDLVAEANGDFTGADVNTWNGTPLTESDYAEWIEYSNQISITEPGVYEITCSTRLQGNSGLPDSHFKAYSSVFGNKVSYGRPKPESQHSSNGGGGSDLGGMDFTYVQFTDKFTVVVTTAPFNFQPTTFAQSYFNSGDSFLATMNLVVRRSGDYIGA